MSDTTLQTAKFAFQKIGGSQELEPADYNAMLDAIDLALPSGSAGVTFSTTNPATFNEVWGKVKLNFPGNVTIGSGGTESISGVRGEIDGAAGTTLKDGFYFGVVGRFILGGATLNQTSAARFAAVFGKVDASSGTMTAGQLSAGWFDMGASAAGAFAPETNIVRATNTTAQAVNAIIYGYGKATYALDLSDNGGGWAVTTVTIPSNNGGGLKILVNGVVRYIPLYTSAPA
jgi:hypothetical protein